MPRPQTVLPQTVLPQTGPVGAQAAALLDAGGPVGDVPVARPADCTLRLTGPATYDLARTARLHGGVGLAPTAWDGRRLHTRLPGPVVVEPDLTVRWSGARPDETVVARVLGLDQDVEPLWQACDRLPELRWVRRLGVGPVLRAPTVWQEVVTTLAAVRTSYRGSQALVRDLVGDGSFPGPEQVLAADLARWGFRAPWLVALAQRAGGGEDLEQLLDPGPDDDDVLRRLRALPGVGPFSAAQLMPLLGRPRPLVLDGWLRTRLGGAPDAEVAARFAPLGRWAGTGAWLAAVRSRYVGDDR